MHKKLIRLQGKFVFIFIFFKLGMFKIIWLRNSIYRSCYRCFPNRPLNINMLSDRHFTSQTQSMSTAKLVLELHTVDPVTNSPLWSMRYRVQAPLSERIFFSLFHVKGISGKIKLRIASLFSHNQMWGWVKYITSWNSEISMFPSILCHDRGLFYHPLIIKNNAKNLGWHIH